MPDPNELDEVVVVVAKVIQVGTNAMETEADGEALSEPVIIATLLAVDGTEPAPRTPAIVHLVLGEEVEEFLFIELWKHQMEKMTASLETIENGEK